MSLLSLQGNEFRSRTNLNGLWSFDIDPNDSGEARGFPVEPLLKRVIGVPGSWNEQFTDLHDYLKTAWYSRQFFCGKLPAGRRAYLRIGAACNHCKAWLNGAFLGEYRIGYLPSVFDATAALRRGQNRVVLKVDSILSDKTLPNSAFDRGHWAGREMAADYFPYCGIHRDVELVMAPEDALENLKVDTSLDGTRATVSVRLWTRGNVAAVETALVDGDRAVATGRAVIARNEGAAKLIVDAPHLWSPDDPHLYTLRVQCTNTGGETTDQYELPIGIRTVAISGDQLLINGRPITIRGFSRHEDFPIVGKAHLDAVMVRDFELMKWLGANSFRTSHYPYDERQYQMADRLGFLVIGEAPAVSLFFPKKGQNPDDMINAEVTQLHQQAIRDMLARDWNHPSVIAWSMANECNGSTPKTGEYFRDLYRMTKELDPTRLVVHTNCGGYLDASHQWSDLFCLNHYDYACNHPGRNMDEVRAALAKRIQDAHKTFGKPVFLSEFGICGIPGFHSLSPLYFTEEGMIDHVMNYLDVIAKQDCVVGVHIWLLHDFKAQESNGRPTLNFKGMFDRLRQPKLIAHLLKQRWSKPGV